MIPKSRSTPYPGLRPFSTEEAEFFFGREHLTQMALKRMVGSRLVAITGLSGAGKSSLVRAGILPALLSGFGPQAAWRVAIMHPGGSPLRNLAEALCAPDVLGSQKPEEMMEALRHSSLGLVRAVRDSGLPAKTRLLVVVDQFEELFSPEARAE
jgi:hypothetical protein